MLLELAKGDGVEIFGLTVQPRENAASYMFFVVQRAWADAYRDPNVCPGVDRDELRRKLLDFEEGEVGFGPPGFNFTGEGLVANGFNSSDGQVIVD